MAWRAGLQAIVGSLLAFALVCGAMAQNPASIQRAKSRWVPVSWSELPGLAEDRLFEAWNAWLKSCERPPAAYATLCPEIRRLSIASPTEQLGWMTDKLQPYRIESFNGESEGLLTAYYEPVLEGSRTRQGGFDVPLYRLPTMASKPWFSRQDIDTLPAAQDALRGLEIAFLDNPIDALVLQIQGSGRLRLRSESGSVSVVRLAYAGTNDQPYRSVGRWLLERGEIKDASWAGIRDWVRANPGRVSEMLWSNPRVVFFKEEAVTDASMGPRGAQGVALTAGRSIAVDPGSVPYGTPVWLSSAGPTLPLQRLVLAQDTGSAIIGAVRADFYAGTGETAGELAGQMKQPMRMWALWPKGVISPHGHMMQRQAAGAFDLTQ
ncbi:MAG: hypothetical protein RLZZ126_298 [Pseudomonadota bacterium]|jgi:membrane-bound lytic murein transglycosylase A